MILDTQGTVSLNLREKCQTSIIDFINDQYFFTNTNLQNFILKYTQQPFFHLFFLLFIMHDFGRI